MSVKQKSVTLYPAMKDFIKYARFYTKEDAGLLTNMLDQASIEYQLDHEVNQLDNIYLGDSLEPMFVLKLPQNQFAKVTALLAEQAQQDFAKPGFTHYLQNYDAAELQEIVQSPNDWNGYDLQVAELLLQEKYHIAPAAVSVSLFSTTYKPEKIATQWIVLGYMLCCLTIVGIFFGLSITQAKKTLQNGETVNIYDKDTIWHGKTMIIAGAAATLLFLYNRLFP